MDTTDFDSLKATPVVTNPVVTPTATPDVQAQIAALQAQIAALQAQPTPQNIADAVVKTLLAGKNLAGFPDDMGLPKEFQLGQPTQNYFVWSAAVGASQALQAPETLIFMAAMLDAMSKAPADPAARVAAAKAALAGVKKALRG